MVSPSCGSRTRASAAWRAGGILTINARNAAPACGPETRTTAIAAGGRPDDSAKIVSVADFIATRVAAISLWLYPDLVRLPRLRGVSPPHHLPPRSFEGVPSCSPMLAHPRIAHRRDPR